MSGVETPNRADELRAGIQKMWASVAPGWAENAEFVDARGAGMTELMLERTAPRPGERLLELACGPGGAGLAAAPLVAPGEVVLTDVAAEMTTIAAERAARLGLANVTTTVLDLEHIAEPDASFDIALCREGLMLVPDPARAACELRRVLRPGGRLALTVWGPRERNPWLAVVFDTVTEQLGTPTPPSGVPQPFSLDDADRLGALLTDAGLDRVVVEEVPVPYVAASSDEWWERTCTLAGPLAQRLGALPDAAARALRDRAHAAVAGYETPAGLELPGVALLATATVD